MKKIVSISVGSTSRDHTTKHVFLGQECELSRQGTNGDFEKAVQRYRELDGKVDAFGIGGVEFFLRVANKRYYFRDVKRIRNAIKISKAGDGNGVKGLLERRAFQALEKHLSEKEGKTLKGMPALQTTAVDRYGMGEAMVDAGLDVTFGDFMFALGLPFPIKTLAGVRLVAALLLPVVTQLPIPWLYPLGSEQDKPPQPKWTKYYEQSTVLAGDFIQIRQYMPDDLTGKIVVTNTTTAKNVEELRKRNLHILVTVTPRLEGRSFGTNVMEATLLALMDKPQSEVTTADFLDLIERIPLEPNIEVLTRRMILDFLFQVWKRLSARLQWRALWFFNSKFMVSVSGVVLDGEDRILLQRHRHWVHDVWGLPGGIVHGGETLEDAFAREVFEETGLAISEIELVKIVSGYRIRLEIYFRARLAAGSGVQDIKLQQEEVLEARFFPLDELPDQLLPLQKRIIQEVGASRTP